MTPKQEEALRDYLQEVIVPLIEEVLVKKLGQAMTFAKTELAVQPAQQEYERGFIDGMQEQMRRSVDRAVNAMAQRTWVGLTEDEVALIAVDCSLVTPSGNHRQGIPT